MCVASFTIDWRGQNSPFAIEVAYRRTTVDVGWADGTECFSPFRVSLVTPNKHGGHAGSCCYKQERSLSLFLSLSLLLIGFPKLHAASGWISNTTTRILRKDCAGSMQYHSGF